MLVNIKDCVEVYTIMFYQLIMSYDLIGKGSNKKTPENIEFAFHRMNLFYLVDFEILLVNEDGIKENRTGSAYNCII